MIQNSLNLSYLLRIWCVTDYDQVSWRASLEKTGSGELRGFSSLDALFAFLEDETRHRGKETEQSSTEIDG